MTPKRGDPPRPTVAALAQALERAIDEYIAAIAPNYPGVPADVIKACELNIRGGRCRCRAYTFRPPGAN
jgi:hypothetical protein